MVQGTKGYLQQHQQEPLHCKNFISMWIRLTLPENTPLGRLSAYVSPFIFIYWLDSPHETTASNVMSLSLIWESSLLDFRSYDSTLHQQIIDPWNWSVLSSILLIFYFQLHFFKLFFFFPIIRLYFLSEFFFLPQWLFYLVFRKKFSFWLQTWWLSSHFGFHTYNVVADTFYVLYTVSSANLYFPGGLISFFHYYLQYFISKIRLCPLINYVHHSKYWIPKAHLLVAAYYLWVLVEVSSTSCYFMNTWLRYQLIEMKCSAKYMPNVPVSWNISCDEPSVIVIKLAVIEKLLKII